MDVKRVAAIDVGATHASAGVVDSRGGIELRREVPSKGEGPPLKERIFRLAAELIEESGSTLEGIAVGAPGIVDSEKGVLVAAGNLPELFGCPLGPEMESEFGLPVTVENDVNAQAMAEMLFGVARGVKTFVMFSIGTDLGGGIVIDGRLHRGAHHVAAEFGHLTLELDGPPCVCGGQGCARRYVSGAGIAEEAKRVLPGDSLAVMKAEGGREGLTGKDVFEAARRGDGPASALVTEFARRFGAVVADVMKVIDPELIVMAGQICRREPEIISEVVKWTRHYYFPMPGLPDFRISELTKETAALGPAAVFFSERGIQAGPPKALRKD